MISSFFDFLKVSKQPETAIWEKDFHYSESGSNFYSGSNSGFMKFGIFVSFFCICTFLNKLVDNSFFPFS